MARPAERHNRHAHRERLAGRDAARIGERIECNIHIRVLCEMRAAEPAHLRALHRNARARKTFRCDLPPLGAVKEFALDEETRSGHSLQHALPECEHLVRRLAEIVEAAERCTAAPLHRQRGDIGQIRAQRIAKVAVRQAYDLLRKGFVRRACRVHIHIREHVVYGRQSRRIEIADARHLHRCRLMREHGQAVVLRMPRQIDENIDLVTPHERCRLLRRHAADIPPRIGSRAQLPGGFVRGAVRIAVHRECRAVKELQERLQQRRHRMRAQIGRDIADADAVVPAHGVLRRGEGQHIGVKSGISARKPRIRRAPMRRQIVCGKERIAVLDGLLFPLRLELAGGEERRDGVLDCARAAQRGTEETVCAREKDRAVGAALFLCGDALLQPGDQRMEMRDLRLDLSLRAVDVDLLPRCSRMRRIYRADAGNLCTCLRIGAACSQGGRTDIAHLRILGQSREQLPCYLRRTHIFLCLVELVCTQQNRLPQLLHILHIVPPLWRSSAVYSTSGRRIPFRMLFHTALHAPRFSKKERLDANDISCCRQQMKEGRNFTPIFCGRMRQPLSKHRLFPAKML